MQTRDQLYASDAFKKVSAFAKKHEEGSDERKQYGSMAHKLPVLIRTAGLAQALSFVEARGKEHSHQQLLRDLAETVGEPNLCQRARAAHVVEYMRLTQKALAALLWYKRFAQSVLKIETGEEGDHDEQ